MSEIRIYPLRGNTENFDWYPDDPVRAILGIDFQFRTRPGRTYRWMGKGRDRRLRFIGDLGDWRASNITRELDFTYPIALLNGKLCPCKRCNR